MSSVLADLSPATYLPAANLRAPGAIALISCYELGHQPLSLASPLAALRRAGFDPIALDTSVQELDDHLLRQARLIALSTPMHTALRLGAQVARRVRAAHPAAHIVFYGLYAALNSEYLLRELADSTIGGEYEDALVALAQALDAQRPTADDDAPDWAQLAARGVSARHTPAQPVLRRLDFAPPARATLPPLDRYAWLLEGDDQRLAGYVEASRGCLHTCAHCPITPVYGGRFFVVPRATVLADIRAQVAAGARHITFGDPDFFNGPRHAIELARALHAEFPHLTFDATIKVEHIIERRALFPELAALGLTFVVTALESLSPLVLRHLAKGHTRADALEALSILDAAGIIMRPTLVAFTPWTTATDYLDLLHFVAQHGLVEQVDAVQYAIRLLVPPGSALLASDDAATWLGALDEAAFTYRWRHPDPRMDALADAMSALVEDATRARLSASDTFVAVWRLAHARLSAAPPDAPTPLPPSTRATNKPIPHLSEPWFC